MFWNPLSVTVKAPVEEVFDRLVDFTARGQWGGTLKIPKGSTWPIHTGSTHVSPGEYVEGGPLPSGGFIPSYTTPDARLTILEYAPNTRLAIKVELGPSVTQLVSFQLQPADGGTQVTRIDKVLHMSFSVRLVMVTVALPFQLVWGPLQPWFRARNMRRFKRYAESAN